VKEARKPAIDTSNPGQALRFAVRRILHQSRRAALVSSATAVMLGAGEARADLTAATTADSGNETVPTEIVVSAQRRTQSLQDVPYNISALSGAALQDEGVSNINGLTQVVAGLMNVDEGPATRAANNNFVLRGLRTDSPGGGATGVVYSNLTVSPVSTYFGETPVFFQMPLDDLERVEVLRGPQGTLYGSGSQAGTIRFIPKRPQFDSFSGEVSADGSYTQYASDPNGSVHGILNIPLSDHLALRLVAGEDHQAGFIKAVDRVRLEPDGTPVPSVPGNLTSGFVLNPVQKGVNTSDQEFARVALRWQPADGVDLQFDYLHQHTSVADSQWGSAWSGGSFDPSFGAWPLAPVNTRPGCNFCTTNWLAEPFSGKVDLMDVVGTVDVGLGTITSSSSYNYIENNTNFDQTGNYYGTANPPSATSAFIPYYPYLNYPRITSEMQSTAGTSSFVQELRFVSKPGTLFDYVVGLYYQRQHVSVDLQQANPGSLAYLSYIGQPNPSTFGDFIYYYDRNTVSEDKAVFGELTYHLTSAWQVTGGVRFFEQPITNNINAFLPLCGAICSNDQVNPIGLEPSNKSIKFSSHVWKFNTSYDFSPTLKVYATASEGFRPGGVSGLPPTGPFASLASLQTFQPDLAKNYEVGVKGSIDDHRITYFADVYLVNLYNFQFDSGNLSQVFGAFNGKQARSEGFELESHMALTDRLDGGFGYAYTKAYITDSFNILDYVPYALIPSQGGTGATASLFGGAIPEGTALPGISRSVFNASVDYTLPGGSIGNGSWKWRFHLDGSYRSSQNSNISPNSLYDFTIPSVFLVNARVSLNTSDKMTYSFFVRNITNNPDISGGINDQRFDNPYRLRDVGVPRTIGVGIRYAF
jgi:iron complex outermembrane receptor protein